MLWAYEPAYDHHDDDQYNDDKYEHHDHFDDDRDHHDHDDDDNDHHDNSTDDWRSPITTMKRPRGRDHEKRTSSQNLQCEIMFKKNASNQIKSVYN